MSQNYFDKFDEQKSDEKPKENYFDNPPEVPKQKDPKPGLGTYARAGFNLTPGGILAGLSGEFNKLLDAFAYKGGGAVTDTLAGKVSPETAAGAGYLTNIGLQLAPSLIGGSIFGRLGQDTGRSLMTSALKPDTVARQSGGGAKAVTTMLDDVHLATPGGLRSLRDRISTFDDELSGVLKNSTKQIDNRAAAAPVQDVIDDLYKASRQKDIPAVERQLNDFLSNPNATNNRIPVPVAQEMKRAMDKTIGDRAFALGQTLEESAVTSAQKAIRRGIRDEIAKVEPAAQDLNRRMSPLINASNVLEKRLLAAGNNNPFGSFPLLTANPKMFALALAERSPLWLSLAAQGAYHGGRPLGRVSGALYGASTANDDGYIPLPSDEVLRGILSSE